MAEKEISLHDLLDELVALKRLVAFKFLRDGLSQEDVAKALGVNQSSVSRMFGATDKKKRKPSEKKG